MERNTYFDGTSYTALSSKSECVQALGLIEDAEEQGLFLRLPCKVGDTVYWNTGVSIREYEVKGYVVEHFKGKKTTRIILDDLAPLFPHPALFFTREAAEAALAKMDGKFFDREATLATKKP